MNTHVKDGKPKPGVKAVRLLLNARFEAVVAVLLLLTALALLSKDALLERTIHFNPQNVVTLQRVPITDSVNGGNSGVTEASPLKWTCRLRPGNPYPFCAYEVFFIKDGSTRGIDMSNMRSFKIRLIYNGESTSFRVHLKNFDPRYSVVGVDDSPKFMRVEADTTPGKLQEVTFQSADFGVADWWLRKFRHAPNLGHPQFDNIISMNIETGSEAPLGDHSFEIQDVEIRTSVLSDAQWYSTLLAIWIIIIVGHLIYRVSNLKRVMAQRQALEQMALNEAREAARRDPLTRLLNRRGLYEDYGQRLDSKGGDVTVTTILIDIDHFKRINDSYGHDTGDQVIASVGSAISHCLRSVDIVARWGGEEFLVVCLGIDQDGALHTAEKIRQTISTRHFGPCSPLTVSIGVYWSETPDMDLTEMVGLADVALYDAKRNGRNRSRMHMPGMSKAA